MCARTSVWFAVAAAVLFGWTADASAGALYSTYGNFQIGDYGGAYTPGGTWGALTGGVADGPYGDNYCYSFGTNNTATWSWSGLTSGAKYDVYASWSMNANRTSNAQYTVNGALLKGNVNQQNSTAGSYYHLAMDQNLRPFGLIGTATVAGDGTLNVVASNGVNENYLIADAVAIHPGAMRIIDDSFAGFSGTDVGHYPETGYYYTEAARSGYPTLPWTGYATASGASAQWAFTDLPNGSYKVYATWADSGSISTNGQTATPWSIVGTTQSGVVNQSVAPNDLVDGATWELLSASVQVTGGAMTVQMGAGAYDSSHIARFDAIRIEQTIPEPGTLILLVTGLIGLLAYAWRRRR